MTRLVNMKADGQAEFDVWEPGVRLTEDGA
jgi:hypothetical protein